MRATLPGIAGLAALAAGGLLLAERQRRHRRPDFLHAVQDLAHRDVHVHMPAGTLLAAGIALAAGGWLLSRQVRQGPAETHTVEESIELEVPVHTAYNQWTQFEDFPKFMATVKSVEQVDDTHLHWRAVVAGKEKEWDAEITEQIPDERIAWRSTSGVYNAGVVTFHRIGDDRTRVMLQMDYTPDTLAEEVADTAGAVKLTAKANLKRFKQLVESRGQETGAWRGTVQQHH